MPRRMVDFVTNREKEGRQEDFETMIVERYAGKME
jgi:hypothetical protein